MSDLLDWQITDAPGADEPSPVASDSPSPYQPRRSWLALSPRAALQVTLVLGSVIVLTLTSIGVYWAWNRADVRAAIVDVIARENEADRNQDWATLRTLVADPDFARVRALPPARQLQGRPPFVRLASGHGHTAAPKSLQQPLLLPCCAALRFAVIHA